MLYLGIVQFQGMATFYVSHVEISEWQKKRGTRKVLSLSGLSPLPVPNYKLSFRWRRRRPFLSFVRKVPSVEKEGRLEVAGLQHAKLISDLKEPVTLWMKWQSRISREGILLPSPTRKMDEVTNKTPSSLTTYEALCTTPSHPVRNWLSVRSRVARNQDEVEWFDSLWAIDDNPCMILIQKHFSHLLPIQNGSVPDEA